MVIEAREAFGSSIFSEIFITACWVIWLTRNDVIFDNGQISLNAWKGRLKKSLDMFVQKHLCNFAYFLHLLCILILLYQAILYFFKITIKSMGDPAVSSKEK